MSFGLVAYWVLAADVEVELRVVEVAVSELCRERVKDTNLYQKLYQKKIWDMLTS